MIRTLVALTLGVSALVPSLTAIPDAVAQPTSDAPTFPDSALEALKGRQVTVSTKDGLSATGELAGFDPKTVTIIRSDAKIAVIQRSNILEVSMAGTTATPAPAPVQPHSPAEPPAPAPAAAVPPPAGSPAAPPVTTAAPPPAPASSHPYGFPVPADGKLRSPVPYRKGVLSGHPDLTEEQRELHQESGLQYDYCILGLEDPLCKQALVLGAEREHASGSRRVILGAVFGGVGVLGVSLGAWRLSVASDAQEFTELCEEFGGPYEECPDPGPEWLLGSVLTLVGGGLLVTGAVLLPLGLSKQGSAADVIEEHEISIGPMLESEVAGPDAGQPKWRGLTLGGIF